ncbi:MAG: hypothetical protein JO142_19215 [Burkholderiales bacterium]|nr:hypothetical protein [Burkholderiales bacterium]
MYPQRPSRKRQTGQSMMEYLIIGSIVAIALFIPFQDAGDTQSRSALERMTNAIQTAYAKFSYAISLP